MVSLWLSVQLGGLGNLLQLWEKRQEKGEEMFLPLTPEYLEIVGEPWS